MKKVAPVKSEVRKGWYIPCFSEYHQMWWAPEECPHYPTKKAALEAIKLAQAEAEALASWQ